MKKSLHTFVSMGANCEADLFMPGGGVKPPVVLLAQGYGAERSFGTTGITEAMVKAGMAVFAFDYRGFGGSDNISGQPRQLIDPNRQLEDWQSALSYVKRLPNVDTARIAIWGSSFAGGHVISVAGSSWSKPFDIKAVVAQIPHCDSRSAFKHVGLTAALKGAYHGIKGGLLSLFGKNYVVPIVGKRDGSGFAVLSYDGWCKSYLEMAKKSDTWKNEVPAKSLLKVGTYNPIDYAADIECPVFIVYGLKDQGIPLDDIERTAGLIKRVEHYAFDGDHFDAYDGGQHHQAIVERQVIFLRSHLCL